MFGIQFYYTIPASLPQARFFIFSPLFAIHSFYELLLPHGRYALFSVVYQKRAGKLPAECSDRTGRKIIFDAGVLHNEIRCDEALFLFRSRRLRPGVIHRMHGFRRRFFIQQQKMKKGSAINFIVFSGVCYKNGKAFCPHFYLYTTLRDFTSCPFLFERRAALPTCVGSVACVPMVRRIFSS